MVMSLINKIRQSEFVSLLRWQEDLGKGRRCMLLSAQLCAPINALATGTLYTAFLTAHQFSMVDVGKLSLLPTLASCFCIFSPIFLERFQKRRWLLAGGRMAYYLLLFLCLTLLPYLTADHSARLIGFGVIIFCANLINSLFSSGYTVWHINFIPDSVRATYFSYQQIITNIVSSLSVLLFGIIADSLRGTPHEALILTLLRLFGLVLAVLDVTVLSLPKEFPYPRTENRIRLSNIFRLPFRNRRFLLTMGIIAFWTFLANLPGSAWTYYLLNDIGTGVTVLNVNTILYSIGLVLFSVRWRVVLSKNSWFLTFAFSALLHAPTIFMLTFITPENYMWLYPLVGLIRCVTDVGLNLSWAGFPYANTPSTDQTYYLSFYTLTANLSAFLGLSTGTWFIERFAGETFSVLGRSLVPVQILVLAMGCLCVVCALLIWLCLRWLQPAGENHT